ncbi:hypothetical protein EJF36_06125 [Bacillus sp. HMF5848]|uniref:hypothetical protein n=1 Tax=Bacillus sp. HMF5848 TaxID=2495421 RepID=UPI000F7A7848|nr:hypothetical protein [Bacillus sp. HMF5848]RSK26469.1 hypothetical protein EJF36_06125 [Bacillus sp. HMF5848]
MIGIRLILYVVGFSVTVVGGVSTIAYLNLFPRGYSIAGYFLFLSHRPEAYLLPIGLLLITISIFLPNR